MADVRNPSPLLFKVLSEDAKSPYQKTDYTAYLPTADGPGKALPKVKRLELCESGWHFTTRPERHWTAGGRIFAAESLGKILIAPGDKIACESGRLLFEIAHDWEWLPLHPVIHALLAISWRQRNLDTKEVPGWANLSRADLYGANLSGANLSRADLTGANLSGANLTGANLSRAKNAALPAGWKLTESGLAVKT